MTADFFVPVPCRFFLNISAPAGVSGCSSGLKPATNVGKKRRVRRFAKSVEPGPRAPPSICQTPERSGLPPTRGTVPVMFTLPSAVRGALGSGLFSHWAWRLSEAQANRDAIRIKLRIVIILNISGPGFLSRHRQGRQDSRSAWVYRRSGTRHGANQDTRR